MIGLFFKHVIVSEKKEGYKNPPLQTDQSRKQ